MRVGALVEGCALAGAGAYFHFFRESIWTFALFWLVFMGLFFASVVIAILDYRYIRVQYLAAQRDLFKETFGDEKFRAALREAHQKARAQGTADKQRDSQKPD